MQDTGVVRAGWAQTAASTDAGARDLLGILLTNHRELTEAAAGQTHQLRALLLRGDSGDRHFGRSGLSRGVLSTLAHRNPPSGATEKQTARHAEIRRVAEVVIAYRNELCANRNQMATIVEELAPGMTAQAGMGPFKAATAILDAALLDGPHPANSR